MTGMLLLTSPSARSKRKTPRLRLLLGCHIVELKNEVVAFLHKQVDILDTHCVLRSVTWDAFKTKTVANTKRIEKLVQIN